MSSSGKAGSQHHGRRERGREREGGCQAGVSYRRNRSFSTRLFSSTGSSVRGPPLPLRLSNRLFRRLSGPVRKSVRRRWTKNSSPARGQIESLVVAEVSVPNTGARRPKRRGGRRSGRIAEVAGRSAGSQPTVGKRRCRGRWRLSANCSGFLRLRRLTPNALLINSPSHSPKRVRDHADHRTRPSHLIRAKIAHQHAVEDREEERHYREVLRHRQRRKQ